jgi:hypothetical protein
MEQVFISYARADDKAFVDRLFHDIEANDIKVWWDHEAMESREKSFLHQIRDAIYKSDRLIAVVGPHAVKSDYVWYEWGHALLFLKELIPILRKGNYDLLADKMTNQLCKDYYGQLPNAFNRSDLAGLHCPDFRNDDNYDRELKKLLRTLKKPVKALPPIKPKEPFVPERFFPRRQKLLDLSELVIPDFKRPVAPSLSVRMTAIQGRGGSGKSVLASVFVKSVKVRMSYENGVVWITLGPETAVLSAMREAGATLGDKSSNYVDERIAEILLTQNLKDKNCLIVLDDVCYAHQVQPFKEALGERCCLLFTTRSRNVAKNLGAQLLELDRLKAAEARGVLAGWCGQEQEPESLPPEADVVAKRCDRLPLALAICGSLIQGKKTTWSRLPILLNQARMELLQTDIPGYQKGQIHVFSPLKVSLDLLLERDKEDDFSLDRYKNYLDLAVLPKRQKNPESVIKTLWQYRRDVDEDWAANVLGSLDGRALLKLIGESPNAEILLHNLQIAYLRFILKKEGIIGLHRDISNALLDWWLKHKNEKKPTKAVKIETEYVVHYLLAHLIKAQLWDELKILLADSEYLKRMQQPEEQLRFQHEFEQFLKNRRIPDDKLFKVLEILHDGIDKLRTGKRKADWLDTFAYWINEFGIKDNKRKRALRLRQVAIKFDQTCGEVSEKLVDAFIKKGENGWALRFAELRAWVYQRAGDFKNCVSACVEAEKLCRRRNMDIGYRKLARPEFIRMQANIQLTRSRQERDNKQQRGYKAQAREAYKKIDERFLPYGQHSWKLTVNEWMKLADDTAESIPRRFRRIRPKPLAFKAVVVSNTHDCISAMHVLQFFEKYGGHTDWIHPEKFQPDKIKWKDTLFSVFIGGPKAPGISSVANKFYDTNKKEFLKMYSGMHFKAFCLQTIVGGCQCYMLGGISKVNTLMAAYEFTRNKEVKKMAKAARA